MEFLALGFLTFLLFGIEVFVLSGFGYLLWNLVIVDWFNVPEGSYWQIMVIVLILSFMVKLIGHSERDENG